MLLYTSIKGVKKVPVFNCLSLRNSRYGKNVGAEGKSNFLLNTTPNVYFKSNIDKSTSA